MRSIWTGSLTALVILFVSHTAQASSIYLGHEYNVITSEGITWPDARTAAQALGAGWDLATIGDAGENTFVESLLNTGLADRSHFWIGGTDAAVEGTWVWIDGTPFFFTNWWGGEPNNFGDEDFLAYDLRGGVYNWNDANNTAAGLVRGFVAERAAPISTVPEPTTLTLVGIGAAVARLSRRRSRA